MLGSGKRRCPWVWKKISQPPWLQLSAMLIQYIIHYYAVHVSYVCDFWITRSYFWAWIEFSLQPLKLNSHTLENSSDFSRLLATIIQFWTNVCCCQQAGLSVWLIISPGLYPSIPRSLITAHKSAAYVKRKKKNSNTDAALAGGKPNHEKVLNNKFM